MRAATLLLVLVPPQDPLLDPVQDRTGEGVAYVDWEARPPTPWVGQSVTLRVEVGIERSALEERLVPLFPRPLDLPVQLTFEGLEDVSAGCLAPYERQGEVELVVGDAPAPARGLGEVRRDGRSYVAVELERRWTPTRPGRVRLPGPRLAFATASGFREDLVHGRVPLDREDAFVRAASLELEVRDVPEAGRPLDFGGAVGSFQLRARAEPRRLSAGEAVRLVVEVEGEGELGSTLATWPEDVPGFRVRGRRVEGRALILELVPEALGPAEVPPLDLVHFDPDRAEFVRASTEPIPLEVRRAPDLAPPVPGREDPPPEEPPPAARAWVLVAAVALVVGVYLWRRRAGRPRSDPDPDLERARAALEAGEDPHAVLVGYLAGRLGCESAGVVGPRLEERLVAAGVDRAAATRVVAVLQEQERARFGGARTSEDPAAAVRACLDALERS